MKQTSIYIMIQSLGEAAGLTRDPGVTNIEVNARGGEVFTDGARGRQFTGIVLSEAQRHNFLGAAASFVGRTIDKDMPTLSMALPEELGRCRLEASVWPLTAGPSMALRKPSGSVFPITDYASPEQIESIKEAIAERKNMLIVGATDSGKTSLLKSILTLYKDICPEERMITLEDTEELVPVLDNSESLFTAPNQQSPEGEHMDMRYLVKKTLRKNPDRLVVGEVRDRAAREVLDGWSTGHNGGICTFHAGNAREGYLRFYDMAGLDWNNPLHQLKAARNIDYILCIAKTPEGRRITEMARVFYQTEKDAEFYQKGDLDYLR